MKANSFRPKMNKETASSAHMGRIYFNTTPPSEVIFHGGLQSEVNTPDLICLLCFIFREAHFLPVSAEK